MDKIQNNAMLVQVRCTKWNNTVTDKLITHEVTCDKVADDGHIRVSKRLAKVGVVKELNRLIGQVGNSIIRKWCVPWDDGVHLVTIDNLDKNITVTRSVRHPLKTHDPLNRRLKHTPLRIDHRQGNIIYHHVLTGAHVDGGAHKNKWPTSHLKSVPTHREFFKTKHPLLIEGGHHTIAILRP